MNTDTGFYLSRTGVTLSSVILPIVRSLNETCGIQAYQTAGIDFIPDRPDFARVWVPEYHDPVERSLGVELLTDRYGDGSCGPILFDVKPAMECSTNYHQCHMTAECSPDVKERALAVQVDRILYELGQIPGAGKWRTRITECRSPFI
jgi:hypothetical protein